VRSEFAPAAASRSQRQYRLPLPDAKVEVFAFVGTPFWDWIAAEPQALGDGIHLLRFSSTGYRPSMFSVLLREDHRVALRVSLYPESDTARCHGPSRPTKCTRPAFTSRER
jgi:hypothetical protein